MYMKHVISDVFAFRTEIVSWNQLKLAQLPDCVASITSLQAGLEAGNTLYFFLLCEVIISRIIKKGNKNKINYVDVLVVI